MAAQEPRTKTRESVRTEMRANDDSRALRTRRLLDTALDRLTAASPADGLPSVVDLTREAGVARSAFYSHFASVDELALARVSDALRAIGDDDIESRRTGSLSMRRATEIATLRVVRVVFGQRVLYAALLAKPNSVTAELLTAEYARVVRFTLDSVGGAPPNTDHEIASEYVAGGMMRVLSGAVRGETRIDEDLLVSQLMELLPRWLSQD